MGTITKRTNKTGETIYKADVRLHKGKAIIARKSASFTRLKDAQAWIKRTEGRLYDDPDLQRQPVITICQLVTDYIERQTQIKPLGKTRASVLNALQHRDHFNIPASQLTPGHLLDYALQRRSEGAGPATILIDIGTLQTVYKEARVLLNHPLDDTVFRTARATLQKNGLIARANTRNRRPADTELDRLMSAFRKRQTHPGNLLPMTDIVEFLTYSCMRLSEMTSLLWEDVSDTRRTVIIRNRKHPTAKAGNHQEIALLGPAWTLLQQQPKTHTRIFPYDPRSISAAFTRVCQQTGIENLHLHDLRRHGISRLLELGYLPSEVAAISGHRDLNILHRVYTQITTDHLHSKYPEKKP